MNELGREYVVIGNKYDNILMKYISSALHLVNMFRLIRTRKIDIGIGISGLVSYVSNYTNMSSICLDDDDSVITPVYAKHIKGANTILTPASLKNDYRGLNHITYKGFHELAYLHPNHFKPDPGVIKKLGIKENDKYFVLRFNAFKAHHDTNEYGMSHEQKDQLIKYLLPHGRVFVSNEKEDPAFLKYNLPVSANEIHSVLYYATLFIGDSQTMTSEAAILGTPALKCNTFAGRLSVPNELEQKYGLCYSFLPDFFDLMMAKIQEFLANPNLRQEFQARRQKMLSEKIDVTAFMVWFIENYPGSIKTIREDPDYEDRFV